MIGYYNFKGCHPVIVQLARECLAKFDDVPYMGGLDQLKVGKVEGRFKLDEYDGSESYTEEGNFDGWF